MATPTTSARPPFPPFTRDSAMQKVRLAEDAWNTRDPSKVALAYTIDSHWRNRSEFINGRNEIMAFLYRKWAKERDYRLIKEMWTFTGNRIAVRFAYEWHDDSDHWYRSYGNENWEFDDDGLMVSRFASINDIPILASDRKFYWPVGVKIEDHVEIFANAVIARGVFRQSTTIGEYARVGNGAFVSHNVQIGKRCFVGHNAVVNGNTVVGEDVWNRINGRLDEHHCTIASAWRRLN